MSKLKVENLDYSIGEKQLLESIDLKIDEGEFVGLIGPNGCGKSTLLKNIYRVCQPDRGVIYLDNENIHSLPGKETAKRMAVMVQENNVEFDMDVLEMVLLGRYAYKKIFADSTDIDKEAARKALLSVGMEDYEERSFLSLSGGEKQRVLIARALAQQAHLIILDEPTNHLDIGYQYQIMRILKEQHITVFSSIHDLNIALHYCDRIILMKDGHIIGGGVPAKALTPQMIRRLFGIEARMGKSRLTGKIQVEYLPD